MGLNTPSISNGGRWSHRSKQAWKGNPACAIEFMTGLPEEGGCERLCGSSSRAKYAIEEDSANLVRHGINKSLCGFHEKINRSVVLILHDLPY